jgi:hypothetical protein
VELLQETLTALQREGVEWPLASVVKDSMRRKYPAFDESEHGFSTFSKFLDDAAAKGIVRLETDPRSGTYRVELTEGLRPAESPDVPTPPLVVDVEERPAEDGEGRRRRRRGRRAIETPAPEDAGEESRDPDAEVFEVIVTPTPDPDLGSLPSLDEPISYEDMIMLGPDPSDDIPELIEASDAGADEPPSRSSRRRRRRAAVADPEPTVADLEPLEAAEEGEPAVEEPAAGVAEAPDAEAAADEAAPPEGEVGSRRRRRRRTLTAVPEEAPAEPEAAAEEETGEEAE